MLGDHVLYQHISAGGCHRRHVCTGLDLIGDDGVGAAAQGVDTADLNGVGTGTGDAGTHGVQEVGKVHDVGLLGRGLDDGLAGDQAGRQHDIHRGTHGSHIQADALAPQALFAGLQGHIFLRLIHQGTQGLETLDVLVDGPGGEVAAAGQCHMGLAEAAQQGTHQVVAGPHLLDQIRVRLGAADVGAVDLQHMELGIGDLGTHTVQDIRKDSDIGNIGHVFDAAFAADQQCRGQDRHGRVFRAADGDGAVQRLTAMDFISGQGISSPCDSLSIKFAYRLS